MRGPIDFIIVSFTGNKFDGSIMQALSDAVGKGIVALVAMTVISKDAEGVVTKLNVADIGGDYQVDLSSQAPGDTDLIQQDDIDEVSDLLENNTAAGLLVIEHLWAKPLKQAILDANGVLVADGRIHPDAAMELNA